MKKSIVAIMMAVTLVGSSLAFPIQAYAREEGEDVGEGETVVEIGQDEEVEDNFGTVTTNNGMVNNNDQGATITTNNETVEYNYGTVTTNNGTVKDNFGTVTTNNGTVTENYGTVTTNDETVVNNLGMVETNNKTVETNNGMVTDNNGTVNSNCKTVETNKGTVNVNCETVETNYGTVENNGVTVTNNFGTVETNQGTVENNFGGTVNNMYDGTVTNQWYEYILTGGIFKSGSTASKDAGDRTWIGKAESTDEELGDYYITVAADNGKCLESAVFYNGKAADYIVNKDNSLTFVKINGAITIKFKDHSLKSCGKKDATCETAGLKEYWKCEECGLYFSKEDGSEAIEDIDKWLATDAVIEAKGHSAVMIPQVDSTVTEYGLMAYWYCKDCNKYFLDEDCKDEIVNFEEWKNGQGRIEKKKAPNPDPNPNPNPTPSPDPNPNPNPTPNPDPNPTPNPDPTPNPGPTPNPEPDVKPVAIGGQKINVSDMFVSMLKDGEKIVSFSIKDKKEKKLASVNKKGEVNPKKTGVIHITAYKKEGKNKNEIGTVELNIVVPTFDKKAMKANFEGQTVSGNLLLSDYELASKNQTVVWKSSKTTVATVDEKTGLITALKSGKTTISVKFMNSDGKSVTKKATFTVKIPKLNVKDTITLKNGKTKKLSLSKIEKTDVVTWSSSDASIVSIEPNKNKAVIKANSTGTAEITATVNGHSYKTIVNVP